MKVEEEVKAVPSVHDVVISDLEFLATSGLRNYSYFNNNSKIKTKTTTRKS